MKTKFDKVISEIPVETQELTAMSFDIAERILDILTSKNLSQKDLANLLGKKESEISKWMKGGHNFTLETIIKIQRVLGEKILEVYKENKISKDRSAITRESYSSESFLAMPNVSLYEVSKGNDKYSVLFKDHNKRAESNSFEIEQGNSTQFQLFRIKNYEGKIKGRIPLSFANLHNVL